MYLATEGGLAVSIVILNEVKNHYEGVSAMETDSSLCSE